MKGSELMIGDIVAVNKTPLHIAALGTAKAGFLDAKGEMFYHYYDNIEPIPLTTEILEKNGFMGEGYAILKLDENSWLEYYYHEHRLRKYWIGIDEWQNHSEVKDLVFQCYCYYFHELQHALKLCRIEKEIEL